MQELILYGISHFYVIFSIKGVKMNEFEHCLPKK